MQLNTALEVGVVCESILYEVTKVYVICKSPNFLLRERDISVMFYRRLSAKVGVNIRK